MKKARFVTVLFIIFVIISLSSCNMVTSKKLIVSNTSSSVDITGIQVNQFVGSRGRLFEDMMEDGEIIAPGKSRTFHIAPSTSSLGTELTVEYSSTEKSIGFTYDYQVDGVNRPVRVSFDGADFSVSGSNAVVL